MCLHLISSSILGFNFLNVLVFNLKNQLITSINEECRCVLIFSPILGEYVNLLRVHHDGSFGLVLLMFMSHQVGNAKIDKFRELLS